MLTDILREKMGQAAKEGNSVKVGTLRLLLSSLEYKKMQKLADLSTEEEIAVVKSEVKKRQEAIEIYKRVNEIKRAEDEAAELQVLMEFLPSQMGEEEVKKVVEEVKEQLGSDANKGQVIGMVMGKIGKENVDGSVVSKIVNQIFS
jgi:uncharacterized protein YqeY